MRDVPALGLTFAVVAVVMVMAGALVVQTNSIVTSITGSSLLMSNITKYTGDALTTFTQFLPVLAIAAIGVYIIGYFTGLIGRQ